MSSISSVSSSSYNPYANSANTNSPQKAFQSLGTALQSGNLSAAQTALQQLQQGGGKGGHHHRGGEGSSTSSSSSSSPSSSVSSLFQALSSAVQSGNLQEAKTAYASLQQTFGQRGQTS